MEQESSLQEIRRNLIESIERLFERIENLEREVARLAENNDTVSAESESLYGSNSLPEVQPDGLPGPADEDVLPEPDAEAATEPEEGKEAENAGGEEEYKAEADWYDWEVDYPASHIDNIYDGIGINDRYEFVRELFNPNGNLHEAELLFKRTVDDLNRLSSFKEVLVYTRARFPQWDEYSDEVYRFYMIVRRKFN